MKTRWIVVLALALLIILAVRPRTRTDPEIATGVPPVESAKTPATSGTANSPSTTSSPGATVPENPTVTNSPASPSSNPTDPLPTPPLPGQEIPIEQVRNDIDNVQFALRDYRTVLGENPVGSNAEITKALLGDNLKQVKIPVPAGSTVNGEGEMCDRWGTPYFFHQLSGKEMEIHSAGPDHKLGTKDDLVIK